MTPEFRHELYAWRYDEATNPPREDSIPYVLEVEIGLKLIKVCDLGLFGIGHTDVVFHVIGRHPL